MRTTIYRILKLGLGLFAIIATLGNSGCLVDSGSDRHLLKTLDQAHLHIYKAGEEIKYKINVNAGAANLPGTITVKWTTPENIPDSNPVDTGYTAIPGVLKETTTVDYQGIDPVTVVRYITQDSDENSPTYGSITLHAFNAQFSDEEHNYADTDDFANNAEPPVPVSIFSSPFLDANTFEPIANQTDEIIEYYVLPDCGDPIPSQCATASQHVLETYQISDMKKGELTTDVDFFETVKVPFIGNVFDENVSDLRKIRLDLRAFCGDPTDDNIQYSGTQWLYPKIGVVRYEIFCTPIGSDTVFFSGNISSTNITY